MLDAELVKCLIKSNRDEAGSSVHLFTTIIAFLTKLMNSGLRNVIIFVLPS